MAPASTLIDLIVRLLHDPAALAEFKDHPDAVLASCGLTDLSPEDVHDALVLADDPDDGSDDSGHHSSSHHSSHHDSHDDSKPSHHGSHDVPPPPPAHHGESEHEAAVRYIKEYVTNNYVDDRDTVVDHSINQQIHTGGGDLDQVIDTTTTTASGDGAVAAAGAIDGSTVTTGDGNQVGEGNVRGEGNVLGEGNQIAAGEHSTTAFGDGAANSATIDHAKVGAGGALSVGDTATGTQATVDSHDSTDTTDTTETSVDGSFNTHADQTTDSHNSTDTHTDTDSNDNVHVDDASHNTTDVDVTAGG